MFMGLTLAGWVFTLLVSGSLLYGLRLLFGWAHGDEPPWPFRKGGKP